MIKLIENRTGLFRRYRLSDYIGLTALSSWAVWIMKGADEYHVIGVFIVDTDGFYTTPLFFIVCHGPVYISPDTDQRRVHSAGVVSSYHAVKAAATSEIKSISHSR